MTTKPMHRLSDIQHEILIGTCEICGPDIPVIFYEKRNKYLCRIKKREIQKNYEKRKYDSLGARASSLRRKYKMTLQEFEARLEAQGNKCAICPRTEPEGKGWHVDHDRKCCPSEVTCGKCVRGILCSRCNQGIGLLGDDISILDSAIVYLRAALSRDPATGPLSTSQRLP